MKFDQKILFPIQYLYLYYQYLRTNFIKKKNYGISTTREIRFTN
jgi:hypothetical protein